MQCQNGLDSKLYYYSSITPHLQLLDVSFACSMLTQSRNRIGMFARLGIVHSKPKSAHAAMAIKLVCVAIVAVGVNGQQPFAFIM